MRGHIAKRGNRYYAVVYEGTDPGTGKDKYKWVAAGTRRSDAERLVNELVGPGEQWRGHRTRPNVARTLPDRPLAPTPGASAEAHHLPLVLQDRRASRRAPHRPASARQAASR